MSSHCKGWNLTAIRQRDSSAATDLILIRYSIPWSGLYRDAPRRPLRFVETAHRALLNPLGITRRQPHGRFLPSGRSEGSPEWERRNGPDEESRPATVAPPCIVSHRQLFAAP